MEENFDIKIDPVKSVEWLQSQFIELSSKENDNFNIIAGINRDDCGAFKFNDTTFVVTSDYINANPIMLKYGGTFYDLGRYLVKANMSDICGTGANPIVFLSNLMLSRELPKKHYENFVYGIKDELSIYETPLIAGDTKIGSHNSFNGVVVGHKDSGNSFFQFNAQEGDGIWCSGEIGNLASSLLALHRNINIDPKLKNWCKKSIISPIVPFAKSRKLAVRNIVHAGTDISDGLLYDLDQICTKSNLGALLYLENLPLCQNTTIIASLLDVYSWAFPLVLGGDMQFMVTVGAEFNKDMTKLGFKKIGIITKERSIKGVIDNKTFPLPCLGHNDKNSMSFEEELLYHLDIVKEVYEKN